MTPEMRTKLAVSRIADYHMVMRTTIFTLLGIAALIHLGPEGYSAPLTMLVVAAVAYGVLAGGTSLDDIDKLKDDLDDATAASNYGQGLAARNVKTLKTISTGLLVLVGLAELYAIFA